MADGMMSNPFFGLLNQGMSPEQAQAEVDRQRALQFANLNPQQRVAAGIYEGITGIGRALGARDPMLEQASQLRQLASQFDTTTAEGMMQYANALRQVNPQAAQQAAMQAQQMMLSGVKIESERALTEQRRREKASKDPIQEFVRANAKNYTPESIQEFTTTGDFSVLKRFTEEEKNVKTPAEFAAVANELGFGSKSTLDQYSAEQTQAVNRTLLDRGVKRAAAGAVQIPGVKEVQDVPGLRSKVLGTIADARRGYESASRAVTLADDALKTNNFASAAGLASALAKASGDTQLSNQDVEKYRTDPAFVGTVSDVVARLVQGTPTADTLKKLRSYAQVLKKKQGESIQRELDTQRELARRAGFKNEDIDVAFGGILESSQKAPRRTASGVTYTVEED
jgi:hypothetical protein